MTEDLIAKLGVAAVVVAFAVWVILDMRAQRDLDRAIIASKDKTIEAVLPALMQANERAGEFPKLVGEVAKVASEMAQTLAVVRDRDQR